METQKIVNFLNNSESSMELHSKFAARKWYIINDQNNVQYGTEDENGTTIRFETKVIKSNLCEYSDAYILVTGNITATGGNANTNVAFKNCSVFTMMSMSKQPKVCPCTICSNIVIITQILLEVCGNLKELNKI